MPSVAKFKSGMGIKTSKNWSSEKDAFVRLTLFNEHFPHPYNEALREKLLFFEKLNKICYRTPFEVPGGNIFTSLSSTRNW